MNIFIYDLDMKKNAQYYPNSHLIKILLEISQMLSTNYRVICGYEGVQVYKPTHISHPCTKWMRESYANFRYAIDLFYALHDEWNYRYQHSKIHKSFEVVNFIEDNIGKLHFDKQELTPFAQAMDDCYKDKNVVTAYRSYFNNKKLHLAKWKNRPMPKWVRGCELL